MLVEGAMADSHAETSKDLAARLERGELVYFPVCPFALPRDGDLRFLMSQSVGGRRHKNISYDPGNGRVAGFRWHDERQAIRLRELLARFADDAARWLATATPRYAATWQRDRASLRPEEEATRRLRQHARNDLLHIDAFPNRPTGGARILRLFANIHPTEPRVWMTAETFPQLLERFGHHVGLPAGFTDGWARRLGRAAIGLFQPQPERTPYDDFMGRFHDWLKSDLGFQEKGPRRFWTFAPGSAWLAFTDGISHAELRGQFAMEHTFFVPVESLADGGQAPLLLLERACGVHLTNRAA
jgi:hypothetical protein